MTTLSQAFANQKVTENGDKAYISTGNKYADLLFLTEYYTKHPEEVEIGNSDFDKLFAMMVRDPRFGLGMRTFGRNLMAQSEVSPEDTVLAGRFDDLLFPTVRGLDFIKSQVEAGNDLAKKWLPRFGSAKKALASKIAKEWGLSKQEYGKFVKVETTEKRLTDKNTDAIKFESVPSNASVKYSHRFAHGEDTKERYAQYLADVKAGKAELRISTTTAYDLYKNRDKVADIDLFFDKLPKISINALPVVDTSGSMCREDAIGKALAIGHYIGKCSTFMPNHALTFSTRPSLVNMGVGLVGQTPASASENRCHSYSREYCFDATAEYKSQYEREIASLHTGDCSNTDFGAVMELLSEVSKDSMPDWIVVLSDQEFDAGSHQKKCDLQRMWKEKGYTTKIVWWNFNGRHKTVPETDQMGNIYISGYNPTLLQYLEVGFDANAFINKLVEVYKKKIGK